MFVNVTNDEFINFTNDKRPRAARTPGGLQTEADYELLPTLVGRRASVDSGTVFRGAITIGSRAPIEAGVVGTADATGESAVTGVPSGRS